MKVLLNITLLVEHPEVSGTASFPLQLRFEADGTPEQLVELGKKYREVVAEALAPLMQNRVPVPDRDSPPAPKPTRPDPKPSAPRPKKVNGVEK